AGRATGLRGPWDVINLACVWGLGQERGHEAVNKEARTVVVSAQLKRTSYRGVVDVVYGGEKPEKKPQDTAGKGKEKKQQVVIDGLGVNKRKAEDGDAQPNGVAAEKPLSKTQMRKQAKRARVEAMKGPQEVNTNPEKESKPDDMAVDAG
ncbi:hypothetical protein LTS18_012302, partial [Coniosporium uncinatum]